jgi:DNA-binding NtrC family response regulator
MNMDTKPSLCLVEDDPIMGESLCDRFELEGFHCDCFKSGGKAIEKIHSRRYAAVVSDIRLPDVSGEELFQAMLQKELYLPPWVFITAYGSVDRAVAMLKLGAADYITKPFDLDELIDKLRRLCQERLAPAERGSSRGRLGVSACMRRIEETLPRLAKQAGTILITGESGVGKEVLAREIHRLESARSGPFVAVNCGGLAESLLESELFGHERGAFTGALRTKRGVFEQANAGTLFLDEIGDMPPVMQVKLLRAIQDRAITRVGGEASIPIDLRLICATHRDLKRLVEQGTFREDLYYRIHVIHLRVPSLRERKEDIRWFAGQFLAEYAARYPHDSKVLTPAAEHALLNHAWPGNLRELRHCIERACILTEGANIGASSLFDLGDGEVIDSPDNSNGNLNSYLEACEKTRILESLAANGWHIGQTAGQLGISRKNLWEKMKKLGIPSKTLGSDSPS